MAAELPGGEEEVHEQNSHKTLPPSKISHRQVMR
jgi:hypothetical protein